MDNLILGFLESFPSIFLLITIGISLYVLGKGADLLVDQAVSISLKWGIPKIIVGATIVSLGTTIPESSVSVISALKGNPDMALGNAIGSIIANTALILGLASMVGRVPVDRKAIERQGGILLLSSLILAVVSMPFFGDGVNGVVSQKVGVVFIIMLIYYIHSTIKWGKSELSEDEAEEVIETKDPLLLQLIKMFFGVFVVVLSSKVLIPSVELLALRAKIPQAIIASTLVAFGTSLPELVTAITSVKKGHGDLAVGNVVGANILNILLVIGLSAAVTKEGLLMSLDFYKIQIPTMLLVLMVFFSFAKNDDGEISKKEGLLMMAIYTVYLFVNYMMA